jgi:phage/plasmid-like protein (TIGR03299 family)
MSVFTVGKTNNGNILKDADLDWTVELSDCLHAPCLSVEGYTLDKRATVRTDNGRVLGIVSENYQIVQNEELVYMAEQITRNNNMKVSTAGELSGGEKVWLSIEADAFNVSGNDDVFPYLLLTNGHNGMQSLGGTPTSVRVICQNTLNMAMREGRAQGSYISIRHKGNMGDKMESLMNTLGEFYKRTEEFATNSRTLAAKSVDSSMLHAYFSHMYNKFVKNVPDDPKSDSEVRAHTKKINALLKWNINFDNETGECGANLWTAMNAITKWLDHDTSYRGENKTENRFVSNFFGNNASTKERLFATTLTRV